MMFWLATSSEAKTVTMWPRKYGYHYQDWREREANHNTWLAKMSLSINLGIICQGIKLLSVLTNMIYIYLPAYHKSSSWKNFCCSSAKIIFILLFFFNFYWFIKTIMLLFMINNTLVKMFYNIFFLP